MYYQFDIKSEDGEYQETIEIETNMGYDDASDEAWNYIDMNYDQPMERTLADTDDPLFNDVY